MAIIHVENTTDPKGYDWFTLCGLGGNAQAWTALIENDHQITDLWSLVTCKDCLKKIITREVRLLSDVTPAAVFHTILRALSA